MPFEVAIKITAESQLEAVKAAEAAVRAVGTASKQAGAEAAIVAAPGLKKTAEAADKLTLGGTGAKQALSLLAHNLGAVGPVGSLAAGALLQVAIGGGAMGVALAATSAMIGLFVTRSQEAAKATKDFDKALRTADLEFFRQRIRDLDEEIATSFWKRASFWTGVKGLLAGPGIVKEARASQAAAVAAEQKLLADMTYKATLAIEFQTAAVGADAQELAKLEHEARVVTALQQGLKDATQATKDAFIAASAALREHKIASESLKGITYDVALPSDVLGGGTGGAVGAQLRVGLQGVKQDLSEIAKYAAQFQFIKPWQLQEAKNLVQGFGEIAQREFGTDIPADIQQMQQALQGVIDNLAKKYKVDLDTADAVSALLDAEAAVRRLSGVAAVPLVLRVDATGAIRIVQDTGAAVDALRAKTNVPMIQEIKVVTTGSPTLPFSEYFESYAPDVIKKFIDQAAGATINLDSGLSGAIFNTLDSIANARVLMAQQMNQPSITGISPGFGTGTQARLLESERILAFLMQLLGRSGGPAGGGGNINITIDASDLLNGLDRTMRLTTGHSLNVRVLN